MKILLIGSGGREHALAWALAKSPRCTALFIAPGNPGTAKSAPMWCSTSRIMPAVVQFCRTDGDRLRGCRPGGAVGCGHRRRSRGCRHTGFRTEPGRRAARGIEGLHQGIMPRSLHPDGRFCAVHDAAAAWPMFAQQGAPIVVKADGLAAGKGVVVAASIEEALHAIDMMFSGGLGAAGEEVVIEECMIGEEASFFALVDGENAVPLPRRRTISALAMVIPVPTPAAWALIRPLPSSRPAWPNA